MYVTQNPVHLVKIPTWKILLGIWSNYCKKEEILDMFSFDFEEN